MKHSGKKIGILAMTLYTLLWAVPVLFFVVSFGNAESLRSFMHDTSAWHTILFTARQAFLSAAASLAIGIIPGWFAARNRGRLTVLVKNSIFIPLFFPPVACVVAFSTLFSSAGFSSLLGFDPHILYTLQGVVLAHAFYNSPFIASFFSESLRSVNNDLIDDARANGASAFEIFFRIELPLALGGLARGFFLAFVYSFMSFAVALGIGGLPFSTIEVEIAMTLQSTFDFSRASILAAFQVLLVGAIAVIASRIAVFDSGDHLHESKSRPGRTSYIITAVWCAFEYGIIFVSLLSSVFDPFSHRFNLSGYISIFSQTLNDTYPVIRSFADTTLLSSVGSALAVIIAYFIARRGGRLRDAILLSSTGISGAFLAVTLVYAGIESAIPLPFLACTGLTVIALPLAFAFLRHTLRSFPETLREEARSAGASPLTILLRIELPMIIPALTGAFLQCFAILAGEFTLSYTLQIQNEFPLQSVTAFSLASARLLRESAAMTTISVVFISVFCYAARVIERKYHK